MISDLQIANLLVEQYAGVTTFPIGDLTACWTYSDHGDVYWDALRLPDGTVLICLRGSSTFQDWVRDAMAITLPVESGILGPLHPGFALGLGAVASKIWQLYSTQPIIISGHSLGAGRAYILAGMLLNNRANIARIVTFGSPKPGFQKLADFLKGIPGVAYRNQDVSGHDLVTDVPLTFPPEDYVHPISFTPVTGSPLSADKGSFRYHHMSLYVKGLQSLAQAKG